MRKLLAAFCLFATSSTALAQDAPIETVTARGNSLVGLWRVSSPSYVAVEGFFSPMKFGPPENKFCRIAPQKNDLIMFCTGGPENATVTVEDDHVHVAWGTMLLRVVLDGALESADHFRGHFQFKLSGITHEDPGFSEATRVMPEAGAAEDVRKTDLLRRVLGDGLAGVPHDADAMKKNYSQDPPKLGAVQTVSYVGRETRWGSPPPPNGKPNPDPDRPDFFSVYLVHFTGDERLCRLHQRDDGVLDALRCD